MKKHWPAGVLKLLSVTPAITIQEPSFANGSATDSTTLTVLELLVNVREIDEIALVAGMLGPVHCTPLFEIWFD